MSILLHGKEYIEVKDRVASAHAEEGFSMLKEETFSMGGREYVRVFIEVKGKQYIGTAECKFTASPKTPDGMSPFECGETSALGRALGFAGYGAVESIASADEVARNMQQDAPQSRRQNVQQRPELTIEQLKALCDEICGPNRWKSVKATLFPPEQFGDLPDDLLSAGQKLKIYNALEQRQRKKQQKVG